MDTKTLINELIESGLTQAEIAEKIGCTQSYISELRTGKKGARLSFAIGTALAMLHKRVMARRAKAVTHG